MHVDLHEMPNFILQESAWICPVSRNWYNIFSANVSDFYRYFTARN